MSELVFEKFEKIGRMNRKCTITEKIDGTNAQICFGEDGEILVGSRTRQIWPEGWIDKPKGCDNAGFAEWVYGNRDKLFEFLGKGRHFGEWCGGKIQRGYGLNYRCFLLFNTFRFGEGKQEIPIDLQAKGLGIVPILYEGDFSTGVVDCAMEDLLVRGSQFSKGFMNPEGVVVYHHSIRKMFKVTYKNDKTGKGIDLQIKEK